MKEAESSLGIFSNHSSAYTKITRYHSKVAGDFLFTCNEGTSKKINLTQPLSLYAAFG